MKQVSGFLALARWKEYYGVVVFLSLTGALFTQNLTVLTLLNVVIANFLSAAFAFMINDVEDWKDDLQDPKKRLRNPISAGVLSVRVGTLVAYGTGAASLALYMLASYQTLLVGLVGLVLGYLYSSKTVRLKSVPLLDVVSHGLFLGVVYFLSVVVAGNMGTPVTSVIIVSVMIFLISVAGDLLNEVRDFAVDKKTGIKNTVQLLKLQKVGAYLSPFTTLLSVGVFGIIFLQLTWAGKLVVVLYGLGLAAHYVWYTKTRRANIYSYPHQQAVLAGLGVLLAGATRL